MKAVIFHNINLKLDQILSYPAVKVHDRRSFSSQNGFSKDRDEDGRALLTTAVG